MKTPNNLTVGKVDLDVSAYKANAKAYAKAEIKSNDALNTLIRSHLELCSAMGKARRAKAHDALLGILGVALEFRVKGVEETKKFPAAHKNVAHDTLTNYLRGVRRALECFTAEHLLKTFESKTNVHNLAAHCRNMALEHARAAKVKSKAPAPESGDPNADKAPIVMDVTGAHGALKAHLEKVSAILQKEQKYSSAQIAAACAAFKAALAQGEQGAQEEEEKTA
jgi:hypothetical protein